MDERPIVVEKMSKLFRLGVGSDAPPTVKEAVSNVVKAPLRKLLGRRAADEANLVWALRDVSFSLEWGECLGVIGRNGSGKSTLLRVLSRITEPTEGWAEIRGRTRSILEVGTGFHPDLTGRDNVFLNGCLLGMSRREVRKHYDEIVAFSEVGRFIDTPVKRYSSGMYVRLAFSIAAHLEGEILIVDEVLAVGDASFQAKCLAKMEEARAKGRTVLLASHDLGAVGRHCGRTLWLDQGKVQAFGATAPIVASYAGSGLPRDERVWSDGEAPATNDVRLRAIRISSKATNLAEGSSAHDQSEPVELAIEFDVLKRIDPRLRVYVWFKRPDGVYVMGVADTDGTEWLDRAREPGRYTSRCEIPGGWLNASTYFVSLSFDIPGGNPLLVLENLLRFDLGFSRVRGAIVAKDEQIPVANCPALRWEVSRTPL